MHEHEPTRHPEPFWQTDAVVGRVRLFGDNRDLHVRTRQVDATYRRTLTRYLVPLTGGRATYLLGQAYVEEPHAPLPAAILRLHHERGLPLPPLDDVSVGELQAWYYQDDRTIVLWDCLLHGQYREADPALDANLRTLWRGGEELLTRRFPEATRLVTPSWESAYDTREYRGFLETMGLHRLSAKAFGKAL
jgi:hypothetical protein